MRGVARQSHRQSFPGAALRRSAARCSAPADDAAPGNARARPSAAAGAGLAGEHRNLAWASAAHRGGRPVAGRVLVGEDPRDSRVVAPGRGRGRAAGAPRTGGGPRGSADDATDVAAAACGRASARRAGRALAGAPARRCSESRCRPRVGLPPHAGLAAGTHRPRQTRGAIGLVTRMQHTRSSNRPARRALGRAGRRAGGRRRSRPAALAGCLRRLHAAEPALRAGLGRTWPPRRSRLLPSSTVRRARPAREAGCATPGSRAWTLPLLWTRPRSGWSVPRRARPDAAGRAGTGAQRPRRDRDRPRRAVSSPPGGRGPPVAGVVLDRFERGGELGEVARAAYGPTTVIPAGGSVHDLARRDRLAGGTRAAPRAGARRRCSRCCTGRGSVESHNGDLLDFLRLRPRPHGGAPAAGSLCRRRGSGWPARPRPRMEVALAGWGAQYAQRVRKAGLVVGSVTTWSPMRPSSTRLWGVFEGSGRKLWCSSTVPPCTGQLRRRDPGLPRGCTRGWWSAVAGMRRSLPAGASCRLDLAACLNELLSSPSGRPYHLGPGRCPAAAVAAGGSGGPAPGSRLLAAESWLCAAAPSRNRRRGRPWCSCRRDPPGGRILDWARPAAAPAAGSSAASTTELSTRRAPRLRGAGRARLVSLDATRKRGRASRLATPSRPGGTRMRVVGSNCARSAGSAGLEFAALLATPAATVEVLDGRWWRCLLARDGGVRGWPAVNLSRTGRDSRAHRPPARPRASGETVSDWLRRARPGCHDDQGQRLRSRRVGAGRRGVQLTRGGTAR